MKRVTFEHLDSIFLDMFTLIRILILYVLETVEFNRRFERKTDK